MPIRTLDPPTVQQEPDARPRALWSRRWPDLVLVLVVALQLGATLWWLGDDRPLVFKAPDDYVQMARLQHLLASLEVDGPAALWRLLRPRQGPHAYLAHYPAALLARSFAPVDVAARAASGLYVLILLLGLYRLGVACHSRGAGLLAAILIFGVRLAVYIATGRYAIDTRLDQLRRDG